MKTKPFILVFPIEVDKEDVDNINGNVYTRQEVTDIIIDHRKFVGDILLFELDEFVTAINEQEIDVLTESWVAYVNVIEEEKP